MDTPNYRKSPTWESLYYTHTLPIPLNDGSSKYNQFTTYCLAIKNIEGLKKNFIQALFSKSSNHTTLRPSIKTINKKEITTFDSFLLKLSFFDNDLKQFVGHTWTSPTFTIKEDGKISLFSIGQYVSFQTDNNNNAIMIVVEFVVVSNASQTLGGTTPSYYSVFWSLFSLSSFKQPFQDISAYSKDYKVLRVSLFYGSSRALLSLNSSPYGNKLVTSVPGCLLLCVLMTHKQLSCIQHLFPPNYFLTHQSVIPGVDSAHNLSNAWIIRPKLLPTLSCNLSELQIDFSQTLLTIRNRLLALLIQDANENNTPTNQLELVIQEEKLKVGIHNGLTFVHLPKTLYLESSRDSDSYCLVSLGSLTFMDLFQHSTFALLFQLELLVHIRSTTSLKRQGFTQNKTTISPRHTLSTTSNLTRKSHSTDNLLTDQIPVCVGWGYWSPFSGVPPPAEETVCVRFQMHQGPCISPYGSAVLRGIDPIQLKFQFVYWGGDYTGDVNGRQTVKRSLSVKTPSITATAITSSSVAGRLLRNKNNR